MYLNNLLLYIFIMPREFTEEQRRLLNIYMNQYAEITLQINELLTSQAEIRSMLNTILFNRNVRQTNDNRERNHYNYTSREYLRPYRYLYNPLAGFGDYYTDNGMYTTLLNYLFNTPNTTSRGATSEEIENSSRLVRYNQIISPITDTCPISLERFQDNDMVRQINYCGHIFTETSFNQWFQTHVNCPVCRHDIRLASLSNNNNTNNNNTNNNNTNNNNTNNNNTNNNNTNNNINTNNTDHEMLNELNDELQNLSSTSSTLHDQSVTNSQYTRPTSQVHPTSSWTQNLLNGNISNINMVRNPRTNIVDHITFDIDNDDLTNNLLNYVIGIYRNGGMGLSDDVLQRRNQSNTNANRNSNGNSNIFSGNRV
jgi:hypothetical protein